MHGSRLVFQERHRVLWEDFVIPKVAPHEIIVETVSSAVSVGTELAVYSGTHRGFSLPNARYPRFPFYPGYAGVGTIVSVGDAVGEFHVGQTVGTAGNHATHVVCDTRSSPIRALPDGVTAETAAFTYLMAISINAVRAGRVTLGGSVLVLGAGMIGQFAAQVAHLAGARPVVLADLIPDRLRAARACGIREVTQIDDNDTETAGAPSTFSRGFDIVIEATGSPSAMSNALRAVSEGGRVVLLGSPRGQVCLVLQP